jgi:DNA polymerase
MYTEPVLGLDADVLAEAREVAIAKQELERRKAGVSMTALRSNPQFAALLEAEGVTPPRKISPTTGKETYAFAKSDDEFTRLEAHPNRRVRDLVTARLACKTSIDQTRAEKLIRLSPWPFSVPLAYCGAITTWRHAGIDGLNLQNLPKKTLIRKAITAPKGYRVGVVDSSNIELRVNHTLAGQQDSIDAFRNKRDLYCEFASRLHARHIDPVADKESPERFLGKLAHLSLGYGCGWRKFQAICRLYGVELDDQEAKRIVNLWRATYTKVPQLWQLADVALYRMGTGADLLSPVDPGGLIKVGDKSLFTPPQHMLRYPGLRMARDGWVYDKRLSRGTAEVKLYGAKLVENWTQHIARNIIAEQWLRVSKRYRVLIQVLDVLVVLLPENEADEGIAWMITEMSRSPEWWPEIPLAAEGKHGPSYGHAK